MKDKLHEQLSALVDDELPASERALLLKQVAADDSLRDRAARYQLISDALRNQLPPQVDAGFAARVQAALHDEPAVHVAPARAGGLFKPVAGFAVAASVAVVGVFSLQTLREEAAVTPSVAEAPVQQEYLRADARSPVMAGKPSPQNLDAYLVNHNEYAVNRGMLPYVRLVGHDMNVDDNQ